MEVWKIYDRSTEKGGNNWKKMKVIDEVYLVKEAAQL